MYQFIKNNFTYFTSIILCLVFISCTGYGKKLKFNETDVYYTDKVTEAEAQKLGEYLVKHNFADSIPKSVQLTKNENNDHYVFRMVVKEGLDTVPLYTNLAKMIGKSISDSVFNGSPVDYHMCDNTFNTKKEIPFEKGE